jgi:hypothetical protein
MMQAAISGSNKKWQLSEEYEFFTSKLELNLGEPTEILHFGQVVYSAVT